MKDVLSTAHDDALNFAIHALAPQPRYAKWYLIGAAPYKLPYMINTGQVMSLRGLLYTR